MNVGADDYITKPFNHLELVARVKSQLRRYEKPLNVEEGKDIIKVKDLVIDTEQKEKLSKESKIWIYLILFKKIKLFKKNVLEMKMPNLKIESKDIEIQAIDALKNIDVDIEQIDLSIQIGIQDAAVTAIVTGMIWTILGIVIKKQGYEVVPIYSNKNLLKIKLKSIFSIYLMQYIYKLIKRKIFEKKVEVENE